MGFDALSLGFTSASSIPGAIYSARTSCGPGEGVEFVDALACLKRGGVTATFSVRKPTLRDEFEGYKAACLEAVKELDNLAAPLIEQGYTFMEVKR
jgi:hypothetical protein